MPFQCGDGCSALLFFFLIKIYFVGSSRQLTFVTSFPPVSLCFAGHGPRGVLRCVSHPSVCLHPPLPTVASSWSGSAAVQSPLAVQPVPFWFLSRPLRHTCFCSPAPLPLRSLLWFALLLPTDSGLDPVLSEAGRSPVPFSKALWSHQKHRTVWMGLQTQLRVVSPLSYVPQKSGVLFPHGRLSSCFLPLLPAGDPEPTHMHPPSVLKPCWLPGCHSPSVADTRP